MKNHNPFLDSDSEAETIHLLAKKKKRIMNEIMNIDINKNINSPKGIQTKTLSFGINQLSKFKKDIKLNPKPFNSTQKNTNKIVIIIILKVYRTKKQKRNS